MVALLSASAFSDFLNGNIFGCFLHAAEVLISELIFTFWLKKRKHFLYRIIPSSIVYFVISVLGGVFFEKYFYYGRYVFAFLLSILLVWICFDGNIWDDLFCIAAASATQNLCYSVSAFVVGAAGMDPFTIKPVSAVIQAVVYVAVHTVVIMLCYKRIRDIQGAGADRIVTVVLSLILAIVIYIVQIDRQSLDTPDFLMWRCMFIGYDTLMLFMLFGMYDKNRLRRENEILDSLRKNTEKQYEFDKRAIEMINIKCHDIKHRLIALRDMPFDSQKEQAFADIEDAVLIYDSIAKTDCKPLDVVLSNKCLLCEKYDIKITYIIDGKQLGFMKSSDIYSLFGNALDNAIREERSVEDREKRIINISVVAKDRFLRISIENYCETSPEFQNGLPITTQKDPNEHGFGMLSMKRIVEHYEGVMSVDIIDKMFTLSITIPLRETQEG